MKQKYERMLQFLSVDEDTRRYALKLGALLYPHLDGIIGRFYANVLANGIFTRIDEHTISRLKTAQKNHWVRLFSTTLNEDYFDNVRRIIEQHRAIDLDPMWYVAGYFNLKIEFTSVIVRAHLPHAETGQLLLALDKYIAIDMGLTLSDSHLEFVD